MKMFNNKRGKRPGITRLIILTFITLIPVGLYAQHTGTAEGNRELVANGFSQWAKGTGSVFDLLAEEVTWTITGSSSQAGTYTGKKMLMDEVLIPLNARLLHKIIPTVRGIYADGDEVIVFWDGKATAVNGHPYNATYAWFMEMRNGKVTHVTAFLDNIRFAGVMKLKPGRPTGGHQ